MCAILLPRWWDSLVQSQRIDAPFELEFEIGVRVFSADHVLVLIVAPLAIAAVGALLRWTRLGIAIRAAAELPTRAGLLGIPVKGLQSVVWSLATVLAFLALFLRAGIYGLPVGGQLGLLLLLRSLAALTLGRMVHLPTILASSIALGILQEGGQSGPMLAPLRDNSCRVPPAQSSLGDPGDTPTVGSVGVG